MGKKRAKFSLYTVLINACIHYIVLNKKILPTNRMNWSDLKGCTWRSVVAFGAISKWTFWRVLHFLIIRFEFTTGYLRLVDLTLYITLSLRCMTSDSNPLLVSKNRSTEGCSKLKRSVDMTSSGKNGLNIRTNANPIWDRTRYPEE